MWPTSGGELSRAQHEHVEPTRVGGGLYGEMADHQLLPMLVLPGCSSPTPRGKPRIGSISPAHTELKKELNYVSEDKDKDKDKEG